MAGWFPSNYTTQEDDNNADDMGLHTYAMAENVLDIVVALYPFTGTSDQELSFEKGDRLEILERPAADPEWYRARNGQGQIGLVPKNYLQVYIFFIQILCNKMCLCSLLVYCKQYLICKHITFQELSEYLAQPLTQAASSVQVIDKPHLVGKPWYYGKITRAQCDTVLNNNGQDGDFLVRDSETNVYFSYLL